LFKSEDTFYSIAGTYNVRSIQTLFYNFIDSHGSRPQFRWPTKASEAVERARYSTAPDFFIRCELLYYRCGLALIAFQPPCAIISGEDATETEEYKRHNFSQDCDSKPPVIAEWHPDAAATVEYPVRGYG
jgi:hypothetical protein